MLCVVIKIVFVSSRPGSYLPHHCTSVCHALAPVMYAVACCGVLVMYSCCDGVAEQSGKAPSVEFDFLLLSLCCSVTG